MESKLLVCRMKSLTESEVSNRTCFHPLSSFSPYFKRRVFYFIDVLHIFQSFSKWVGSRTSTLPSQVTQGFGEASSSPESLNWSAWQHAFSFVSLFVFLKSSQDATARASQSDIAVWSRKQETLCLDTSLSSNGNTYYSQLLSKCTLSTYGIGGGWAGVCSQSRKQLSGSFWCQPHFSEDVYHFKSPSLYV